jgi:hypothetical protein
MGGQRPTQAFWNRGITGLVFFAVQVGEICHAASRVLAGLGWGRSVAEREGG